MIDTLDDRSFQSVDQIEQQEVENPDQVDKVPVESYNLNRGIVLTVKLPLDSPNQQPGHQTYTDQNVNPVQTGHHVVDTEKDVGLVMCNPVIGVVGTGENAQFPLMGVLNILDHHKHECKSNGDGKVYNNPALVIHLGTSDGHSYGE